MGPGILPETTVSKHNPPCHLQMPTKALSCKKEAVSPGLKRRETFQRVISVQFKSQHLWWYGGAYGRAAHFVLENCNISQFKHLLCYLCFIVNKILAHVIWNSFSFHFIQIKKNVPTFPGFGLYLYLFIFYNLYKIYHKKEIKQTFIYLFLNSSYSIERKRKNIEEGKKNAFLTILYLCTVCK